MANLTSLIILAVFFWGRSLRFTNLRRHIQLMLLAMAADISLVAALVFWRQALDKVDLTMPLILQIHVPIAILTVVFYVLASGSGLLLWRGYERARWWLRWFDRFLVTFRVLTLVTSVLVPTLS